MIEFNLSPFEARVLGVLAEKASLTPDVYPLSLNAVVNACNQLSNREPVMSLGEETVGTALTRLQQNNLAQTTIRRVAASQNISIASLKCFHSMMPNSHLSHCYCCAVRKHAVNYANVRHACIHLRRLKVWSVRLKTSL